MNIKHSVRLALTCSLLALSSLAWGEDASNCTSTGWCPCGACMRNYQTCEQACGLDRGGNSGGYDDGGAAARRRAQAAEAVRRAEEQRRRDAELEQQRINAENKRRMEEIANQAKFIDDRNAAAGTLRGSTGTRTTSTGPALRGSSVDTGLRGLRSNTAREPNLDPMVVDARKVPSGLPKSVDDAIASGYSGAPPGVSDRVHKGFQAVATHDWKVARAWFQDALNRDPGNAGLKRLVELADYTEKHIRRGNTGKPSPSSPHRTPVQMPEDSDIQYLFPDLKPAQTNPTSTLAGTPKRTPQDSDLELLFPGLPAIEAKKLNDYMFDQAIKMTANDPLLIKVSNRSGYKKPKNLHEPK